MAFAFVHKNEQIRNIVQWVEKQVQIRKKNCALHRTRGWIQEKRLD